jgi:dTDP-4-dehydrorhamnose reductase
MLGTDLVTELERAGDQVLALTQAEADVTRLASLREAFSSFRPDWVFHLAAFTRVDECETNPELAHRVNALGSRNAALAAGEGGAAIQMISTDYVFDGRASRPYREDDPPAPLSVYGASKLEGEIEVRDTNPRHQIVRTSWLYGRNGTSFPTTILRRAREGVRLKVVDDQRGAPTWTADLANAMRRLAVTSRFGTYHCTASGECTWHEFAVHVVERAGLSVAVDPIDSGSLARPAPRPAYSVLSNWSYEEVTGHRMPDWKAAADRFLDLVLHESPAP